MNITRLYHRIRRHATLNNAVLAAAVVVVFSGVWNTVETLQKNFLLQRKVDLLKQQIEIATIETETLRLQQQYLRSPEYLELTARAKLGKALPGEHVIVLPALPPRETAREVTTTKTRSDDSMFAKWMQLFFGR